MNFEELQNAMFSKKGAVEETPFGPEALVFKVMSKMFALIAWEETPLKVTLKCDPDYALALRDQYEAVTAGYYMSKKHWNSIVLDGTVPDDLLMTMIDESYALVVKGLRKVDRLELEQ